MYFVIILPLIVLFKFDMTVLIKIFFDGGNFKSRVVILLIVTLLNIILMRVILLTVIILSDIHLSI
jgi:hypothetical protein